MMKSGLEKIMEMLVIIQAKNCYHPAHFPQH
jgi:hypothetical protein